LPKAASISLAVSSSIDLRSAKAPVDAVGALSAAPVAASGNSQIPMPEYSPETTRYTGPYYLAMVAPVFVLGLGVISTGIYEWIARATCTISLAGKQAFYDLSTSS
jgi:hypothetical protein